MTFVNQPSEYLASKDRACFANSVRAIVGNIDVSIRKMEQFDHAAIISDALVGRSMLWRHAHSC